MSIFTYYWRGFSLEDIDTWRGSGGDMSKAQWGNYLYEGEKIMYA